MFGFGRDDALDFECWNDFDTWRFAWGERLDGFIMFASTAWGDQYAYKRLANGTLSEDVYFLEGSLMRPQSLAATFDEFVTQEMLKVVMRGPYDTFTQTVLRHSGAIDPSEHWVLSPPLALGGDESAANVMKLKVYDALAVAGDIAHALAASDPGSWPTRVDPWTDERGRLRVRVAFSQ